MVQIPRLSKVRTNPIPTNPIVSYVSAVNLPGDYPRRTVGLYDTARPPGRLGTPETIPGNRAGVGVGANAASTGPEVPPASHINTSADTSRSGGGGHRIKGKVDHATGSLVESQALKERGVQKEQETGAFKMHSAEVAKAERLEKEALAASSPSLMVSFVFPRRLRLREDGLANGVLGAHPNNMHLGGMQNADTLSDVTGNQSTSSDQAGAGGY